MTLFFTRGLGDTPQNLVPSRSRSATVGTVHVDDKTALKHSAVWASVRLRADLVSSMPLHVFRSVGDVDVSAAPTPFLANPAGDRYGVKSWLYASQVDLDRNGNTVGIVRAFDALGKPAMVELVPWSDVTVYGHGTVIDRWRIGRQTFTPAEIWHERQYDLPGVPVGLGPVTYGALTIGTALSAQEFAADWFRSGAFPSGVLRNGAKVLTAGEATTAKDRFKESVGNRDLFVVGKDWEYKAAAATAVESGFLETLNWSIQDAARFMGVPGDLIDAPAESGAKITYANITQRHLQLLVLHLGPVLGRREAALSMTLPNPRYARFDQNSILRMDPQSLSTMLTGQVAGRILAPSEARATLERVPFTEQQFAEFDRLFPTRSATAPATTNPVTGGSA